MERLRLVEEQAKEAERLRLEQKRSEAEQAERIRVEAEKKKRELEAEERARIINRQKSEAKLKDLLDLFDGDDSD